MSHPRPTRLQLWTLRNLCAYDALPCTVRELALRASASEPHTEEYLQKLKAGRWVSVRRSVSGDVWQPTKAGFRIASEKAAT